MEEIHMNAENEMSVHSRPSTNQTGTRSSGRRFHGAVVFCLGLLLTLVLARLISVCVYYHNSLRGAAAELSTIKANLTERLQASEKKLSALTEERDLLKANINKRKTCPAGWTVFNFSFYYLSTESGSWTKGREDCRNRGADLVVIDSDEEQVFLSGFTNVDTWIGLSESDKEGTWKWVDGTPLNLTWWSAQQPNNGSGDLKHGEECSTHILPWTSIWNDRSCKVSLKWICEKTAL